MAFEKDNSNVWELQERTDQAGHGQEKGYLACPLLEKELCNEEEHAKRERCIQDNFTLSRVLFETIHDHSLLEQDREEFESVGNFWIRSRQYLPTYQKHAGKMLSITSNSDSNDYINEFNLSFFQVHMNRCILSIETFFVF